jgi:predicted nucleotidyltransferase
MKSIQRARARSDEGIDALRRLAADVFGSEISLIIGVNGSYARREATAGSDIDLFYLISGNGELEAAKRQNLERKIRDAGFKLPAVGGVFSDVLRTDELLTNIGGLDDSNASLTRRLLLLLEGEWLFNQDLYLKTRRDLLSRYISENTPKGKIALFLLNDIIRYWRTICVDYEYKTSDGKKAKGIRLVKLRFSRMLLTFGGIIAIAETFDLEPKQKLQRLEEIFAMDVLTSVESIMGGLAENAITLYDEFLEALDNNATRENLSIIEFEGTVEFVELRKKGREFKDQLLAALTAKYATTHPIHKALLL